MTIVSETKTILLTNLGNRNIVLDGRTFYEKDSAETFLVWSKNILDNYSEYKDRVQLNIINPLLEKNPPYNEIVLFYSDQRTYETRTDQDTLYEAEVVKRLIVENYSYTEVQVKLQQVKARVIANGDLINFYREFLRKERDKNADVHFTICDAGGTAQQKMAIKVAAEYILTPDEYDVKYVTNNKIVTDVNVQEYRGIINKELAISAMSIGQYLYAASLLDYKNLSEFQSLNNRERDKKLFAHIYFRYHGNDLEARANLNRHCRSMILKNFFEQKELTDSIKEFEKIDEHKWILILDKLRKSLFLFHVKRYNDSVMAYSQFYEALLEEFMKKYIYGLCYGKPKSQDEIQLDNLLKLIKTAAKDDHTIDAQRLMKRNKINFEYLSTQLLLFYIYAGQRWKEFAKILGHRLEYSWNEVDCNAGSICYVNQLRNKIAHEGLLIKEEDVSEEGQYYFFIELLNASIDRIGLSNPSTFEELNDLYTKNFLY